MSNLDNFEKHLNSLTPPEPVSEHTCEIVHPVLDEYIDTLMEDCQKIDPVDMNAALAFVLTDAEQQVMSCMAQEVMNIYASRLDESESAARDLMAGPDGDAEEMDETPILMPREALEAMMKQSITIAYLVLPKVVAHFD
jgi:hypothetical protein